MNNQDNDKTVRKESVPPMSSGTHEQGGPLLETGMMQPPQTPGTLGMIGKYQVVRILGEGGMGQVLLAREPVTDSLVAIKIIKPEYLKKDWAVHRFLTEARHMFKMSHPSMIRVLEVSDRPEGPYFVMPYMAGGSLAQKIKPGEPLSPDTIAPLARQVAEALQYAHGRGIIHRDLKTSNILLDPEGRAYLCDFGLLRTVFNDSMVDVTKPQVEGTVPYMSPAIAGGKAEDTRCDIYAFGCLLYEMLTGQPPYQGPSVDAILKQIQAGPPQPIRQLNPQAPARLVAIAEHAMGRELRDRYSSMSDVINDLDRAAQGKEPLGPHGRTNGFRVSRKALAAIGVVVLIALAVFGISKLPSLISGSAAATPQDQFTWTTNNSAITITKYVGSRGTVNIPSTISGLPVTAVGGWAFMDSTSATNVTIPASVTNVWLGGAFVHCTGLLSIVVDPKNPAYSSSADGVLFNKQKTCLEGYPGGKSSYVIPKGITSIQGWAFRGYPRLTNLVIPNSVTNIGAGAFYECSGLTSVTIPKGVSAIWDWTFHACSGLASVTIPDSVKVIADNAFSNCTGLTNIVVPNSVTTIPSGGAFSVCLRLNAISVDAGNPAYSSSADGVLFNKDKTCIVGYPGGKAGHYEIPSGVTTIGQRAFCYRTYLTGVTIPDSVTTIDTEAFRWCQNLTGIYFKGNAPRLGQDVFADIKKATVYYLPGTTGWGKEFGGFPTAPWNPETNNAASPAATAQTPFTCTTNNGAITLTKYTGPGGAVTIPSTINGLPLTSIGSGAFKSCAGLTSVTIPKGVTTIENEAFHFCASLANVAIPDSVISIGDTAFRCCSKLTGVTIPASVTSIGTCAFMYCPSLTSMAIPKSVTVIPDRMFEGCTGLANVTIPNTVTSIGSYAFVSCNLASVAIPNSVTWLGTWAFCDCRNLTNVTIPSSVSSMGPVPFHSSGRLKSIIVDPANPVFCSSADGVLFNKEKTVLIEYPGGRAGSYVIPNSVTNIGLTAFWRCGNLTSVTIPNSVTNIGEGAFHECSALTSVTIPNSVTSIEGSAFGNCVRLTSVKIPASVTSIKGSSYWGENAFGNCPELVSIMVDPANPAYSSSADGVLFNKEKTCLVSYPGGKAGSYEIPNGVTKISQWALCACTFLTSVTIPEGVTDIDAGAFKGCDNLTGIYFKGNAPRLGKDVFADIKKTTIYHLPEAKGWGPEFGGFPTAPWNPPAK